MDTPYNCFMKNLTQLPAQHTTTKSIFDYTEDELNRMDYAQDEMRGYIDNSDEDLESFFGED